MPFKGPKYSAINDAMQQAISRVDIDQTDDPAPRGTSSSRRRGARLTARTGPQDDAAARSEHQTHTCPREASTCQRRPAPSPGEHQARAERDSAPEAEPLDAKVAPYAYISPFFVLFALVGLFPLVYTFWVSVHDWNLIGGKGEFVGLDNYAQALGQENFWIGARNTVSIFLLSGVTQTVGGDRARGRAEPEHPGQHVLADGRAPAVRRRARGGRRDLQQDVRRPVRPHQQPARGSAAARSAGTPTSCASHVAISTMVNFRWTGYVTLIFLAAMQAIPSELYEAAVLDGASRMRQFFSVTVPMLRPTIIFVVITATIGGLQIFDEPRVFDQKGLGGADRQWMTMTMYIYELGWGPQKSFGRAAAVSWLLFLFIILIGVLNYLATRRIASSESSTAKKAARTEGGA